MKTKDKITTWGNFIISIITLLVFILLFLFLIYPILLLIIPVSIFNTILFFPLNLIQLLSNEVTELTGLGIWHARAVAITVYALLASFLIGIISYPFSYPKFFIKKSNRLPFLIILIGVCVLLGFINQPNFSPSTGEPLKKYYKAEEGRIELFPIEWKYHPIYGDSLKLITKNIIKQHENYSKPSVNKEYDPKATKEKSNNHQITRKQNTNSPNESKLNGANKKLSNIKKQNKKHYNDNQQKQYQQKDNKINRNKNNFNVSFQQLISDLERNSNWSTKKRWIDLISTETIEIYFTKNRKNDAAKIISRLNKANSNVRYQIVSDDKAKSHSRHLYYRYGDLKKAHALQNIISDVELIKLRRNEEFGRDISLWLY